MFAEKLQLANYNVHVVTYPGRYDRSNEIPFSSTKELAIGTVQVSLIPIFHAFSFRIFKFSLQNILSAHIKHELPIIFIGNSFGGCAAYECAFHLEHTIGIAVNHCIKIVTPSYADEVVADAYFDDVIDERRLTLVDNNFFDIQKYSNDGNFILISYYIVLIKKSCIYLDGLLYKEIRNFAKQRLLHEEKVTASLTMLLAVDDPSTAVSILGKRGWMVTYANTKNFNNLNPNFSFMPI